MSTTLKQRLRMNGHNIILIALGILYFGFLIRYYLIDYYVPDFKLYFQMALSGAKARDGFSSLFIWFAGFAASMPTALTIFSLLLISVAMVNTSFFIKSLFRERCLHYYVSIIILYSCCAFYYFYGKIFYDFPFTAFTYSVCLLVTKKLYVCLDMGNSAAKPWRELCVWLGLLLSWKPYNIFCVAGLALLMLGRTESKSFILSILKSVRKLSMSFLLFFTGYLIGNYNLLIDPKETMLGIRAYPARFDFKEFLLTKSRIIWDHVNDLPFNITVMLVPVTIVLLFVVPIIFKKFWYLFVSIIMASCAYLYVQKFSPGFAWHGFTMGLFIVTFAAFLLSDIQTVTEFKWKNAILVVVSVLQAIECFGYYIPLQIRWYSTTEDAIQVLEECENEIYADVSSLLSGIGDAYYMIDEAVIRYKPVAISAPAWKDINCQNTYFVATNYAFLNPLEATNYSKRHK